MSDWSIYPWGETPKAIAPEDYPEWFYPDVIRLDFSSAIPTDDYMKQNFSTVPRHWFIDAWFYCEECKKEFCWTALEQKRWFDELHFYVGSHPNECRDCRKKRRRMKSYQANIKSLLRRAASFESKEDMVKLIHQIEVDLGQALPESLRKNLEILEKQIAKMRETERKE